MSSPSRPALRYLGGKWRLAPWIIRHLPPHRVYVEPFGGAASVLLRKAPSYAEVYNDLDGEVVNLFRVLRAPELEAQLVRAVMLTPFARSEFEGAYAECDEPVERARRLLVRSFMGHGNIAARIDRTTGFRRNSNRSGTTPAHDWRNYPPALHEIADRMRGVVIEQKPALEVIAHFDGPDTLTYADPPYVHATRSEKRCRLAPSTGYRHELSDADHVELLSGLRACRGMVVLSGYAHPLYERALVTWRRLEISAHADGARDRTEVLWLNPAAVAASGGLFDACEVAA